MIFLMKRFTVKKVPQFVPSLLFSRCRRTIQSPLKINPNSLKLKPNSQLNLPSNSELPANNYFVHQPVRRGLQIVLSLAVSLRLLDVIFPQTQILRLNCTQILAACCSLSRFTQILRCSRVLVVFAGRVSLIVAGGQGDKAHEFITGGGF